LQREKRCHIFVKVIGLGRVDEEGYLLRDFL
jgi:hypothetical protein